MAKALQYAARGYRMSPAEELGQAVFAEEAVALGDAAQQLGNVVLVRDIEFYSTHKVTHPIALPFPCRAVGTGYDRPVQTLRHGVAVFGPILTLLQLLGLARRRCTAASAWQPHTVVDEREGVGAGRWGGRRRI